MNNYYISLLKKMFLIYSIFLAVFAVIVYTIYLVYTAQNYKHTETNILEQTTFIVDKCLSDTYELATNLIKNDEIITYAQKNGFSDPSNVLNAQKTLKLHSARVQNFCNTIAITSPNTDHIITSSGSQSTSYFIQNLGMDTNEFVNRIAEISTYRNKAFALTTSSETSNYLLLCMSHTSPSEQPIIFIAVYDLKMLFEQVPPNIIKGITNIRIKDSYISYDHSKNKLDLTQTSPHNKYKTITTISKHSHFWGSVDYIYSVPFFTYFLHINNFFALFIFIILLLLFIGTMFIKNVTTRMYKPIEKLLLKLPIDSYDNIEDKNITDISLLSDYIDQLISQKNTAFNTIFENHIHLEEKFIIQLLNGLLSVAEIKQGLTKYNMSDKVFPVNVCIIKHRNFDTMKNTLDLDGLSELRYALHSYFSKTFKNSNFFKIIDIEQHAFAIIISADNEQTLKQSLKSAMLQIEANLYMKMFVGIGLPVSSWNELAISYKSALSVIDRYMPLFQNNIIVTYNDALEDKSINYSSDTEKELINSIFHNNPQKVRVLVESIIDSNVTNLFMTKQTHSQFIILLYATLNKVLSMMNKTESMVFKDTKIYLELMECTTPQQLKHKLNIFIDVIIKDICDMRKITEETNTHSIIAYIDGNYPYDISLVTLADHLNVSQSYASKIFKKLTGTNFKDYLANVRLSKSVELMKDNPTMKLSEIAEKVGYRTETFTRAFTKKYGILPSNYINILYEKERDDNNES